MKNKSINNAVINLVTFIGNTSRLVKMYKLLLFIIGDETVLGVTLLSKNKLLLYIEMRCISLWLLLYKCKIKYKRANFMVIIPTQQSKTSSWMQHCGFHSSSLLCINFMRFSIIRANGMECKLECPIYSQCTSTPFMLQPKMNFYLHPKKPQHSADVAQQSFFTSLTPCLSFEIT